MDIGSHWGYFSHCFEKKGFDVYSVEPSKQHLYFLNKLKRASNLKFNIINESIFPYYRKNKRFFDIVLALDVFHHFLKKKKRFLLFKKFLHSLRADQMFFQLPKFDKSQMENYYKNFKPVEFVKFIISNSCFNKYLLIGKTKNGEKIYKLYK